ncbi:MAG: PaaI family thioesterase [Gammaproteobacteria bacterium]
MFGRDSDGFPLEIPFLGFLGLRALEIADGRSVLVLEAQQRHHQNSFDMAHGGVVMTMLDVAMAMAGRSLLREGEATGMITIEMKTSFMQPARGALRAEGRCIQRTASMAFCEADLLDPEGRLVARSSGTFKYARHRKTAP